MRKVTLVRGPELARTWPLEDASVDKLVANEVAEYLLDPVHFMNEAWRVLKDGGELDMTVLSNDGRLIGGAPGALPLWNEDVIKFFLAGAKLKPPTFRGAFRIQSGQSLAPDKLGRIWLRAICTKVPVDAEQVVPESVSIRGGAAEQPDATA